MNRFRQRARFLLTLALVLGLHLTMIWLLLVTTRRTMKEATSAALEIAFYSRPTPPIESKATIRRAESAAAVHHGKNKAAPLTDVSPRSKDNSDVPASVDWADELTRTARDAASEDSTQKSRDFGFPHRPATPASNPPQFGWDDAATHRIQSIPEGGLLVHLNDNCVLVFIPFPFAMCGIGKKEPNGHLFDHMHDPSQPADENQPK